MYAAIHVDRAARSMLMTDFSIDLLWMTEFSVPNMLQACVTLGFFNSLVLYNKYGNKYIEKQTN
jgi:hypothetical protein